MSFESERPPFLRNKRNVAGMTILAATIGFTALDWGNTPDTESNNNPYSTPTTTINMAEIGTENNLYTIDSSETPVSKAPHSPTPFPGQEVNVLSTMTGRNIPIPEAVETPNS